MLFKLAFKVKNRLYPFLFQQLGKITAFLPYRQIVSCHGIWSTRRMGIWGMQFLARNCAQSPADWSLATNIQVPEFNAGRGVIDACCVGLPWHCGFVCVTSQHPKRHLWTDAFNPLPTAKARADKDGVPNQVRTPNTR